MTTSCNMIAVNAYNLPDSFPVFFTHRSTKTSNYLECSWVPVAFPCKFPFSSSPTQGDSIICSLPTNSFLSQFWSSFLPLKMHTVSKRNASKSRQKMSCVVVAAAFVWNVNRITTIHHLSCWHATLSLSMIFIWFAEVSRLCIRFRRGYEILPPPESCILYKINRDCKFFTVKIAFPWEFLEINAYYQVMYNFLVSN